MRKHAALLGARGGYEEVRVGFLKEEPLVADCLKDLKTDRVLVVPDFLAEGYFTRQVIPGMLNKLDNNDLAIYCPPVGTHPVMAELIGDVASRELDGWQTGETSLLVVGHGSGKNACSKQTLLHHLEEIRVRGEWAQVQDLWLEEDIRVGNWRSVAEKQQVIVVPYLLNDGQHGGWDIPKELGVAEGAGVHGVTHELEGCQVRITPALGTSDRFADAIEAIATIWSGS